MRLEAQAKLGFYPVKSGTIEFVTRSLTVANPEQTRIIDPCCGAGEAIHQVATTLQVPPENVYGIELDEGRAEKAAGLDPNYKIMNASFFNVRIVPVQSFSLAWVNPPYDNECKQGDESGRALEWSFLNEIARYVVQGGIIMLHMPLDRISQGIKNGFHGACLDCKIIELPPDLRPYREAILVGKKRALIERSVFTADIPTVSEMPAWVVPAGEPIKTWQKFAPTDDEILKYINRSSWKKMFTAKKERTVLRPVLPLGAGHLGLTLASGLLDGYFAPEGWEPHVVRGIAYKTNDLVKEETEESESGKVTNTQTFRENIKLKIRAVTADGTIHEKV